MSEVTSSIKDYEVIRPIGKGKFATVYRAKRLSDGEVVALKKIAVDVVDEKSREKCLKEVKLLQSLDHPNIIHYSESFLDDKDLIIIVEWAAAGDLKRQLRKAQEKQENFEERVVWKYFSQISEAMRVSKLDSTCFFFSLARDLPEILRHSGPIE